MNLSPCVCGHEATHHSSVSYELRPRKCGRCSCPRYTLEGECQGRIAKTLDIMWSAPMTLEEYVDALVKDEEN